MSPPLSVHMNQGEGGASYARNSTLQGAVQRRMKPLIEETVRSFCGDTTEIPSSMVIADLGCSSGPNALFLASTAVDAIRHCCIEHEQPPPELCIVLNDLPNNDFNVVAKSLAAYQQSQESAGLVMTSMVPGSFHGRLFNKGSVHLFCSSNSLHWLSQAPKNLVRNKIPAYDMNEATRPARRAVVARAYAQQFKQDFAAFLASRAQELAPGGRMALSMVGLRSHDADYKSFRSMEFSYGVLHEMASMGLIQREKIESFYTPVYAPAEEEVREVIEAEGSFAIDKMELHENTVGNVAASSAPKTIARTIRAVVEPMIVQHFGCSAETMDEYERIVEQRHESNSKSCDEYGTPRWDFIAASLAKRI